MAQLLTPYRNHDVYEGDGAADGNVMILINNADKYENYVFVATTGQIRVEINNTMDATKWSNPVALQDMAGTLIDQGTPATNKNAFGLVIRTTQLRVKADAAAAIASVTCWATGRVR
jgi:hypothetical protein